jgi:quinol monooxygenase YgiN
MSVTVVALNRVNDYDAWRKTYDSKADFRQAAGITRESVHQATDDPNSVLLTHRFATADQAQAFLAGPGLRAAMEEAGVVGPPRIEIYQDA